MDPSKILLYKIGRLQKVAQERRSIFLGIRTRRSSFKKRLKDAFARPGFLAHPNDEAALYLGNRCFGLCHFWSSTSALPNKYSSTGGFYSRQNEQRRRNYDIYDKELLAVSRIIQALETLVARGSSSSDCLVRSQESGIFYVDQES
ncbi:hypothetical protein BASA83_013202 [Batrachochytrium salamandrivorans]|nr:hypothetical protein BASA83_013202 [Batrachochytrium salamandrivorans]